MKKDELEEKLKETNVVEFVTKLKRKFLKLRVEGIIKKSERVSELCVDLGVAQDFIPSSICFVDYKIRSENYEHLIGNILYIINNYPIKI